VSSERYGLRSQALWYGRAASAHADSRVIPLGTFSAQSNAIVIGVVSQVTPIGGPGGTPLVFVVFLARALLPYESVTRVGTRR
jgi:hypothetical protein